MRMTRRIRDEMLVVVAAWLAIVGVMALGVSVAIYCQHLN